MDRSLVTAAAIMSLGMLLIPLGDAAGKLMTNSGISPLFVAWTRYGVGIVFLAPFVLQKKALRLLKDWRIWVRSAAHVLTIITILTALSTEPIALVFGAFFLGPMVSYILSIWLLKEDGNWQRIVLLLIGLGGVFLVVKPGFGMTPGLGWALLSGVFYGMFLTASRWVAPLGRPVHLLLSQLLTGTLILTPFSLTAMPETIPYGLVTWSAVASMLGNLLLVLAYARAGASTLAPFVYVQLIGATFYGVVFFNTWPDWISGIGIAVIFCAGTATLFLRKRPTPHLP